MSDRNEIADLVLKAKADGFDWFCLTHLKGYKGQRGECSLCAPSPVASSPESVRPTEAMVEAATHARNFLRSCDWNDLSSEDEAQEIVGELEAALTAARPAEPAEPPR